jgi:hypothetical protein
MISVTQWKLRRLASRALRVLERRKEENPLFAAYEYSLVPAAENFIKAYDSLSRYKVNVKKEKTESKVAARDLFLTTRGWLPLLKRDIPQFNEQDFNNTQLMDDILEDGNRLYDFVTDYRNSEGNELPYAQDCLAGIDEKLTAALKEINEAENADSVYQAMRKHSRNSAVQLQSEIVAFRKSLAVIAGRNSTDYQKLRESKSHLKDEDDDKNVPLSPKVEPAKPGENPILPS